MLDGGAPLPQQNPCNGQPAFCLKYGPLSGFCHKVQHDCSLYYPQTRCEPRLLLLHDRYREGFASYALGRHSSDCLRAWLTLYCLCVLVHSQRTTRSSVMQLGQGFASDCKSADHIVERRSEMGPSCEEQTIGLYRNVKKMVYT